MYGFYIAATGMEALQRRQDVLANNIANVSTPGFKAERPITEGFYAELLKSMRGPAFFARYEAPGGGVRLDKTYLAWPPGPLHETGNPLDIALQGNGMLAVQTPQGERFTRNGALTLAADGTLVTKHGFPVLSVAGNPIRIEGGNIVITQEGRVLVNGTEAAQLRLVEATDPQVLIPQGLDLLNAGDTTRLRPAVATTVHQGMLENANVNVPKALIELTLAMRAYEANQRVIQAMDGTLGGLIDRVSVPA
jgi:flagellar basal-body rod protein FlgF